MKYKKLPKTEFKKEMHGIHKTKKKLKEKVIKIPIEEQLAKEENLELETQTPKEKPKKMPDNMDEYFAKVEGTQQAFHSRELFRATPEDVDLKTDLSIQEIVLVNKLLFNNHLLKQKGLKPVYTGFLNSYMRLKISLDRKSRGEFVSINRADKTEEATALMANLSNINQTKK